MITFQSSNLTRLALSPLALPVLALPGVSANSSTSIARSAPSTPSEAHSVGPTAGVGGGAFGARSVSQNLNSGRFLRGEGQALMAAATIAEISDGGRWRPRLVVLRRDGGVNFSAGLIGRAELAGPAFEDADDMARSWRVFVLLSDWKGMRLATGCEQRPWNERRARRKMGWLWLCGQSDLCLPPREGHQSDGGESS